MTRLPVLGGMPAWAIGSLCAITLALVVPALVVVLSRLRGEVARARLSAHPRIAWLSFALRLLAASTLALLVFTAVLERMSPPEGPAREALLVWMGVPAALAAATVTFFVSRWLAGRFTKDRVGPRASPVPGAGHSKGARRP
jgi:hypothetical protein